MTTTGLKNEFVIFWNKAACGMTKGEKMAFGMVHDFICKMSDTEEMFRKKEVDGKGVANE